MHDLLGVDPRAVIDQITVLRLGRSANIELFQYEAPDQRRTHPRNSDWSGHHVAFYVTDIDAAVAHMVSKGVEKFLGPFSLTEGPAAGQSINYFKTPFGTYIELISYPKGMAYERPGVKPLWSPKRNGLRSKATTVPGLLGIDHVGITVPNVVAAAEWFERVLGGSNPLTFGPFSDPTGDFMQQLVDVDPRAVVEQIRMVRAGNGPGVELFQYSAPDQDRTFRKNSDWGAHHIAFYVRHIEKAVKHLQAQRSAEAVRPLPRHRRPRRRADDQLLRDALRHRHRADQLSARDGVRGDGVDPALGSARQPPVEAGRSAGLELRRRAADDEGGLEHANAVVAARGVAQGLVDDHLDRAADHLLDGHPDGGQRRNRRGGERDVVEADDREVRGHAEPALERRVEHPDREDVRRRRDRGRRLRRAPASASKAATPPLGELRVCWM